MRLKQSYLFLLIPLSFHALADDIYLKNGNIISGTVNLVDSNNVLVTTDYAGQLKIDLSKVKSFSIEHSSSVKKEYFAPWESVNSVEKSQDGNITLVKGDQKKQMALNKDLVINKNNLATGIPDKSVSGSVNAGAAYNKGSSKNEQYSLNGNLKITDDFWRHGLGAALQRNKDDGNVSTYYYNTNYELDRFFNPGFFWRGDVKYQHDWVEDIKSKASIGTGPGWQVWNDELVSLSLTSLMSYQKLKYRSGSDTDYIQGAVGWDYNQYILAKLVNFYTKGSIGRSFNDDVSLDLNVKAGLMYNITDSINLNTNIVREKINSDKGDSNNTNYTLGVGYKW
ncbi:DUF481 domain-containing protein [Moellerella wisconsensis]|uniref:Peptide chain release factor RF-3 n=4 Tax=Gammaproteobacteria TaxID=1236 RepID=A0A0N0IC18_9GAMM|nr:DUF481 domain-containing protein [Moellerella wisconsensis]KLN97783.1 hypothetical protein VK86_03780 [Moellerella wisconsensis]KPD04101.1 hypothetical protein M992_0206 [Moellerella wisconsensis ATCC 35017]UNH24556.1 DUF481 domain-containing protein [Moellerella wisconsensis]UNH27660.1 DUF481 domain-containing protein [Moellerella wisconsensis]UNH31133.1 DUF481 domain-containing protein [Moellerella wisconsensis]